jgi:hypothetical protein
LSLCARRDNIQPEKSNPEMRMSALVICHQLDNDLGTDQHSDESGLQDRRAGDYGKQLAHCSDMRIA